MATILARRRLGRLLLLGGLGATLGGTLPARAGKAPIDTSRLAGVALGGYDPVAYHALGRPTPGDPAIESVWRGARWRFASPAHRALFEAEPERYAPRYGGYCAWAVAQGYTAPGDPEAWRIVEGRLYLNYDRSVQRRFEQDIAGNVAKADGNWPEVLDR